MPDENVERLVSPPAVPSLGALVLRALLGDFYWLPLLHRDHHHPRPRYQFCVT